MKRSSFNPETQNQKIESRILVALERISEAFRVLLWEGSREYSLSPIQIQLLIFLRFHEPEKCRVGYLADEFNMTRATISDSIRVLIAKGLVYKEADPTDSRSFVLSLTPEGERIAGKNSTFASAIEQPIEKLSTGQKNAMLKGLLSLVYELNRSGIIAVQRMCFTCSNYQADKGAHFCRLLNTRLHENELRLDCPEHAPAV